MLSEMRTGAIFALGCLMASVVVATASHGCETYYPAPACAKPPVCSYQVVYAYEDRVVPYRVPVVTYDQCGHQVVSWCVKYRLERVRVNKVVQGL